MINCIDLLTLEATRDFFYPLTPSFWRRVRIALRFRFWALRNGKRVRNVEEVANGDWGE